MFVNSLEFALTEMIGWMHGNLATFWISLGIVVVASLIAVWIERIQVGSGAVCEGFTAKAGSRSDFRCTYAPHAHNTAYRPASA